MVGKLVSSFYYKSGSYLIMSLYIYIGLSSRETLMIKRPKRPILDHWSTRSCTLKTRGTLVNLFINYTVQIIRIRNILSSLRKVVYLTSFFSSIKDLLNYGKFCTLGSIYNHQFYIYSYIILSLLFEKNALETLSTSTMDVNMRPIKGLFLLCS